jgi:glucoamylase
MPKENLAPGAPGDRPHWASAAKTGVGTALRTESNIWFTLSQGIVTEVFYPFVDSACTRGMGCIVTDRRDFVSDEQQAVSEVSSLADGVPAYRMLTRCPSGRYQIEKTILADPRRPVLLQETHFQPLQGELADYALFVLLEPHLDNQGADNTAWIADFKGVPMLFAKRGGFALALACSAPWRKRSAGFVGRSDGRSDLYEHKDLRSIYDRAANGNVCLTGEIDLVACAGRCVLALAFGLDEDDAAHRARASLLQGFESARQEYVEAWQGWVKGLLHLKTVDDDIQRFYQISGAVLRTHESKDFPGGIVSSLATPWGDSRGDEDKGYHRAWPRDMIETVGGLLAIRAHEDARRVLFYLHVTQEADGHWPQNMFLNGRPSWNGIQLDETAFVILLVDLARREGAIRSDEPWPVWEMVRKAAGYLVCHGPVSPMDRWEEEAGYAVSTMAVEIAALVAASEMADGHGERRLGDFLRETADTWNAEIESLLYVSGTELAKAAGVEGYYVRFARPDQRLASGPAAGSVALKNHQAGEGRLPVAEIVSPDALALVRFGLRSPADPRIVNTVRVIDHLLKVDTPSGPAWHRYNEDGYGEHADGAPFDGTGIGRLWPLLTGERGHYEVAAGRPDRAEMLLRAMEGFANSSGLISEQIWDAPDIPARELFFGRPTGSAMPLVWAHAEYVKLRRSLADGRVFDMPAGSAARYVRQCTPCRRTYWRFEQPCRFIPRGYTLRLEVLARARMHWSGDNWETTYEQATQETGLGLHYADLPSAGLSAGESLRFTFYWPDARHWEGRTFEVQVQDPEQSVLEHEASLSSPASAAT